MISAEYKEMILDVVFTTVVLPIFSLFLAYLLQRINKAVSKFHLPYSKAFKIQLLAEFFNISVLFLITSIVGFYFDNFRMANALIIVLTLFLRAPFYASMIIHPTNGSIGWTKGIMYSIMMGFLGMIVSGIIQIASFPIMCIFL